MKAKRKSLVRGLVLGLATCAFALAFAACGDTDDKKDTGDQQQTQTVAEVTAISVTRSGHAGYTGAEYTVSYTVSPSDKNVSIYVKKNGSAAVEDDDETDGDYTYKDATKKITFLKAGTYTVTATPVGGGTAKTSSEIVITEHTIVSNITLGTGEEEDFLVGEAYAVTVTTSPENEPYTVSVKDASNNPVTAGTNTYEYDATTKKITFRAAGTYTVVVTLDNHPDVDSEGDITVEARVPTFELTATANTFAENDETGTTISVGEITYPDDSAEQSKSWNGVQYKANANADFATATAGDYALNETTGVFMATKAGIYRVSYKVVCTNGHEGTAYVDITVTPAVLELNATTTGWQDISTAKKLEYTVSGYVNNYTVSYETTKYGGASDAAITNSETTATSVTASADKAIVAAYKVVYTHNVVSDTKYEVSFDVHHSGATSVIGTTAANKTHNTLISGVALKLYEDVQEGTTVDYAAASSNVEVKNIENVGKVVVLKSGAAADDKAYVAVTATKGEDVATAIQEFTVADTAFETYALAVLPDAKISPANAAAEQQKGIVLTKTGVVVNRDASNSFDYNNENDAKRAVANITLPTGLASSQNFAISMKVTILAYTSNGFSMAFRPYTGTGSGTNSGNDSKMAIYSENNVLKSGCWSNEGVTWFNEAANRPAAVDGSVLDLRLVHYVVGTTVSWVLQCKSGTEYVDMVIVSRAASETAGNLTANVVSVGVFNEKGSYLIDDVKVEAASAPSISNVVLAETLREDKDTAFTYDVANTYGQNAAVKVQKKNGETYVDCAENDYTIESDKISFAAVGEYKVIISLRHAADVVKTITVTPKPVVTVTLKATGKKDADTPITVSATNTSSEIAVKVEKWDEDESKYEECTSGTDYTYDGDNHKIVFKATGQYQVTASIEEDAYHASKVINIYNADVPSFTINASENSVVENTESNSTITITPTAIVYDTGENDGAKEGEKVVYTVKYRATDADDYAAVAAEDVANYYELGTVDNDNKVTITLKMAGDYEITGTITSKLGLEGTATVKVTATPATIQLTDAAAVAAAKKNGWYRVANDVDVDIPYIVQGEAGNYVVTYENGSASQTAGNVKVHLALGTYTVKVIYTHSKVTSAKVVYELKVSVVSDVDNAPILGEDPFGGTYGTLIPSTGLQLYYSATKADGTAINNYEGVTYEVIDVRLEGLTGEGNNKVSILKAQNNDLYPYVIVEDYEDNNTHFGNDAHGTITVKMTVTVGEGADAKSTIATKVFTVEVLGEGGTKNAGLENYIKNVFDIKDMKYDKIIAHDLRQNMVVTKSGVLYHRGDWGSGELGCVDVDLDDFQVDFTYIPVTRLGGADVNKVSFCVNFRTGKWEGYCGGQTAFYAEKTSSTIVAGYWSDKVSATNGTNPEATLSSVLHVRLVHTVANDQATFVWKWSTDGTNYTDWFTLVVATSSVDANIGAKVNAMQFNYEAGCFILGAATVTNLTSAG